HPALLRDQLIHRRVPVVGRRRKLPAESRLWVVDKHRRVPAALVADDDRPVIRDEFGEKCDDEQREKDPQRPEAASVPPEGVEPPPRERCDPYAEKAVGRTCLTRCRTFGSRAPGLRRLLPLTL